MRSLIMLCLLVVTESLPLSPNERQSECVKLQSAYQRFCPSQFERTSAAVQQGRDGKRGANGIKGEQGIQGVQGLKGEVGEVDYERLEAMFERKLQQVREESFRNYTEMKQQMAEDRDKIERLRRADVCQVNYQGKCFWLESKLPAEIRCNEADSICEARGGKPANIYSDRHHYMLMGLLRTMADHGKYSDAIIGMTYNIQTNAVLLTDGTNAPYVKWYPGNPTSSSSSSCLVLIAREPWDHKSQHIYHSRGDAWRGLFCERDAS